MLLSYLTNLLHVIKLPILLDERIEISCSSLCVKEPKNGVLLLYCFQS